MYSDDDGATGVICVLFFACIAIYISMVLNYNVKIESKIITHTIELCETHGGLKYFSKDAGGELNTYCSDNSEYHEMVR